jgi:hypothetical protein
MDAAAGGTSRRLARPSGEARGCKDAAWAAWDVSQHPNGTPTPKLGKVLESRQNSLRDGIPIGADRDPRPLV